MFAAFGWACVSTAHVGAGFPDLVVCDSSDRVYLIEVKTGKKGTKPQTKKAQADFAARFPVARLTSAAEAEVWIRQILASRDTTGRPIVAPARVLPWVILDV